MRASSFFSAVFALCLATAVLASPLDKDGARSLDRRVKTRKPAPVKPKPLPRPQPKTPVVKPKQKVPVAKPKHTTTKPKTTVAPKLKHTTVPSHGNSTTKQPPCKRMDGGSCELPAPKFKNPKDQCASYKTCDACGTSGVWAC